MDLAEQVIARLESAATFGYHDGSESATEPVALSAIAMLACDRASHATPLLEWLANHQAADGSIGVDAANSAPGWPTPWAVVAWRQAQQTSAANLRFAAAADRGIAWLLTVQGELIPRIGTAGHDTMIKGWPWVEGTHAWLEPTAISLLALRHAGHDHHPRACEAVRLLQDRTLAHGGCNYGNTVVFGQELRPHIEPTGLCLLALAGQPYATPLSEKSIDYLLGSLSSETATASLCYGLLGLAAQGRYPAAAGSWLDAAARRTLSRDPAPYKLALLALARLGTSCPLIPSIPQGVLP